MRIVPVLFLFLAAAALADKPSYPIQGQFGIFTDDNTNSFHRLILADGPANTFPDGRHLLRDNRSGYTFRTNCPSGDCLQTNPLCTINWCGPLASGPICLTNTLCGPGFTNCICYVTDTNCLACICYDSHGAGCSVTMCDPGLLCTNISVLVFGPTGSGGSGYTAKPTYNPADCSCITEWFNSFTGDYCAYNFRSNIFTGLLGWSPPNCPGGHN